MTSFENSAVPLDVEFFYMWNFVDMKPWESGWVVYGPENGYNFPYSRLLSVNSLLPIPLRELNINRYVDENSNYWAKLMLEARD